MRYSTPLIRVMHIANIKANINKRKIGSMLLRPLVSRNIIQHNSVSKIQTTVKVFHGYKKTICKQRFNRYPATMHLLPGNRKMCIVAKIMFTHSVTVLFMISLWYDEELSILILFLLQQFFKTKTKTFIMNNNLYYCIFQKKYIDPHQKPH